MQVDEAADIKTRYQFHTQVIPVNSLVDPFLKIDLDLFKDKIDPFINMFVINVGIIFFQVKGHRRTHIAESFTHFFADRKQNIDGIYAFKIIGIKNNLKVLPFQV